ncbi:GNAT family N-acetyltransferase [Natrialba asiatica]|uniref:N-acetyltransferase GCN5 n=1 Tax=Natrialba asiatica (strain ATCC 700177 / DSM 12278 / JCM 9576 / FERM P-10747 / NBRC 102637 / 172P1) TaxID=29540 RepID=M0AKR6_NATA1|nr:GNAT family N-acetyltransferase [Natrialba asiatica]ELY98492.1 N-acetyltransferase GCN5 [Natrialba asiatica DSM 12278]
MEIRPATADDRSAIREVARDTWHDTYDDLASDVIDDTVDDWYDDDELERALSKPGTAVLVAETDAGVVGFTHGVVQDDEGDVLRMYVHPDHQREGVGTALHERLRDDLADFNMNRMRAIDLASNATGRAFYEELGFEETDTGTVELGGEAHEEVVYTLSL